jgi:hypothetical protein
MLCHKNTSESFPKELAKRADQTRSEIRIDTVIITTVRCGKPFVAQLVLVRLDPRASKEQHKVEPTHALPFAEHDILHFGPINEVYNGASGYSSRLL